MTEKLTIDTPEQIALDYQLAGVGSRSVALAVDTLIQGAIVMVIVMAIVGTSALQRTLGGTPGLWPVAVGLVLAFVIFYGYFAIFEIAWHGQTPGKRLVGVRAIAASGRPLTAQAALLRNLVRIVDSLPGFYALGILSVLVTRRSQRLGDLAAGSVVVHERAIAPEAPEPSAPGARRVGAASLRADEHALVDSFLQRRADLPWEVRERTADAIASRLRRKLDLPEGGSDEELIEQVAAEYREGRRYR